MRHQTGLTLTFLIWAGISCATVPEHPFQEPNALLKEQIGRRIHDLEYLHGMELVGALDWLTRVGEKAYPQLIDALEHRHPTTRSSAANVLGRGADRRVIPFLKAHSSDADPRMRYEIARALLKLGDWSYIPVLVTGLRDDSEYVRALCNDALKRTTKVDFGFVANASSEEREQQVQKWEDWWEARIQDSFFTAGN